MSQDRLDAARQAGKRAADRARELRQRSVELSSQEPITPDHLDRARDALTTALERAAAAHRRSAEQHVKAAERHDQAASLLEAHHEPSRAQAHRRAAEADREAALVAERQAAADDP